MTLETLLNKLIELGWFPWGQGWFTININEREINLCENWPLDCYWFYSLNDLCSIDSWIWQFVCEKWLYVWSKSKHELIYNCETIEQYSINFWLMLSSIQEDKTRFLLDNIKLPDDHTKPND